MLIRRRRPVDPAGYPTFAPFAESPFLEQEIARRPDLGSDAASLLRRFARDGYGVLPRAVPESLVRDVREQVAGLFDPSRKEGPASYYRKQDAWTVSPAARDVALLPSVMDVLRLLYGRTPLPFQTLHFLYGSQQYPHSDAILFNSLPARFMCGVWIALEDVDAENGPLFYYPGSHRLPEYGPEDWNTAGEPPDVFINFTYPRYAGSLMSARGLRRKTFHARRGDALVWASNLVHGGMPRLDASRTRWSQVTHYYFEGCVYHSPLSARPAAGEFALREVRDFRTGEVVPQTYNGEPFAVVPAGGGRSRLVFEREPWSVALLSAPVRDLDPTDPVARAAAGGAAGPAPLFHLDEVRENDEAISLTGWAVCPGFGVDDTLSIEVIAEQGGRVRGCPAARMARPDVRAAHGGGVGSGFRVTIKKSDVPPGRHRVGVAIRSASKGTAFAFLGREFEVAGR